MQPEHLDPLILQNDQRHETLKNLEVTSEHQLLKQDEMAQGIETLNQTAEHLLLQGDDFKNSIEKVVEAVNSIPKIEIPEQKEPLENISIKNFPDIQKVEIINHEKEDTKQVELLKDILEEVKKKEEYDLEISFELKEKLKGEKGNDGYTPIKNIDYFDGKKGDKGEKGDDGKDIDPETLKEIQDKISFLDKKQSSKTTSLSELDDVNLTGLKTDSQGNYILNQIDDEISATNSTYSSSKIDNLIANIPQGSGSSKIFYLTTQEIIAGYDLLSETANTTGEVQKSVSVNNSEALIHSYITDVLNLSSIPAGNWAFTIWANANHLGNVSNIIARVYKRTAGETETLIFEKTSQEITSTTYQELAFEYIQATATPLLTTDKLVVKFFAKTTRNNATTISIFYGSSERYSHIHTPIQNIAITWEHLAINGKTDGTEIATTGGVYFAYTYKGSTIYRFLSTAEDANGYNVEDGFYATLSSGVLSNLIVTKQ